MADLSNGGTTRITVLADAGQALPAIDAVRKQLYHLGRRYRLIPIHTAGAFHPKICVRLSRDGAIIACGSSNLTRAGWLGRRSEVSLSGNRELVTTFVANPGSTAASNLRLVREELQRLPILPVQRDAVFQTLSQGWLDDVPLVSPVEAGWLLTGVGQSLTEVLEQRWSGRRFRRLRFVTGSTDVDGKMLRWAHRTFGITEAEVHVDLDSCSFSVDQLRDLPVEFRVVGYNGLPRSHLKLALFESDEGPAAAVVGSANCSDSAWIRPLRANGNVESVIVHDKCDSKAFEMFFRADVTPSRLNDLQVPVPSDEGQESETTRRLLRSIQLDSSVGQVRIDLEYAASHGDQLFAVVAGSRVPLNQSRKGSLWYGPLPDLPQESYLALFGFVEIISGEVVRRTNEMWVDDQDALTRAAEQNSSSGRVGGLGRAGTSEQYRELLADLQILAGSLLDSSSDYADSVRTAHGDHRKEDDANATPVDPGTLLRSLSKIEAETHHLHKAGGESAFANITLTGIMRLLFAETEAADESGRFDPATTESQKSTEEEEGNQSDESGSGSNSEPDPLEVPTEKQAQRLLDDLNLFVDRLADPAFAARCTARQLQQAVAYPIAATRFVSKGPWAQVLPKGVLNDVVERLCELLLRRVGRVRDKATGEIQDLVPLLQTVRYRYQNEGRSDVFDQIIGDGTLWLVLSASVLRDHESASRRFGRNLILRDIIRSEVLITSALPDSLRPLAERLAGGTQLPDLVQTLEQVYAAFSSLESYLNAHESELKKTKCPRPQNGDWLWNSIVGFARIDSIQADGRGRVHIPARARTSDNVDLGYYSNLRWASETDSQLQILWSNCTS